jgi:hypothetical protein
MSDEASNGRDGMGRVGTRSEKRFQGSGFRGQVTGHSQEDTTTAASGAKTRFLTPMEARPTGTCQEGVRKDSGAAGGGQASCPVALGMAKGRPVKHREDEDNE